MTERTDAPQQPLNCDRDPARWAREFNEVLAAKGEQPLDPGLLISWFANAMMCGEDTYRWRMEKAALSEIVAPGELESLRVFQRKIEEAEARCCPEDVGFEEYIAALKKRLAIPSNMEDRFLIQECATWIRRLAARIKQYQPQLAKKAVDWLHRKEIQGSPLRDAETISDSETPEVRKEREGYETAIALSYECDRLREELAKARSAIAPRETDPYKRNPEKGRCKCGLKEVPAGCDGVQWYWQRHARYACTLELPNLKCWCGRLRSEHIDGHDETAPRPHASADGTAKVRSTTEELQKSRLE